MIRAQRPDATNTRPPLAINRHRTATGDRLNDTKKLSGIPLGCGSINKEHAMSVTKFQPRKPILSPKHIDVIDAIESEIRFAQGIELAILGESSICSFDPSDLCALTTAHVERLRAVAEKIASLKIGGVS